MKTGVKTQMNKKTLTLTIAILVTASLSIAAYFLTTSYLSNYSDSLSISSEIQEEGDVTANDTEESEKPQVTSAPNNTTSDKEERPIIFTHAQMAYDPSDTEVLVKNKPVIFIGKLGDRTDDRVIGDMSIPTFKVLVLSNIKSQADQEILLGQGDLFYRGDSVYVTSGDAAWPKNVKESDILLKQNSVYVFVADYSESLGRYAVSLSPYDRVLISSDPNISSEAAVELAKQNARVQEIIEAARTQGTLNEEWR